MSYPRHKIKTFVYLYLLPILAPLYFTTQIPNANWRVECDQIQIQPCNCDVGVEMPSLFGCQEIGCVFSKTTTFKFAN